ncbi:MAG: nuclear transport factor 2 family protein [Cyclobacteriaceae bacterium]|jgi:hypothetical protein|nr:nuclear transport factor 2 family protein [Cytophagales bacterium]MCZ8329655.1 nuclear transport factor 2 family protein [Cyclobacteriaceae bacterium]
MTLKDKGQIEETCKRLVWAIDRHDWKLALEQFRKEVTLDYTELFGGVEEKLLAETVIERWSSFLPRLKATQHTLSNFLISEIDGDALCYSYVDGFHYLPNDKGENYWNVKGFYTQQLKKQNGKWVIHYMKLTPIYQSGNLQLLTIAQL